MLAIALILLLSIHCQARYIPNPNVVKTRSNINFQIHSYDDIKQWPSLFAKGATWFKVDFNWQNETFCKAQKRVINATDGCFILMHNTPVHEVDTYDTSDSLMEFLQTAAQFQSGQHYAIAMCGKDGFGCNPLSISKMDSFYESAMNLNRNRNVSLEFILDGSASPSPCTLHRWLPWNSTWTPPATMDQAEDNNVTNGDYRYQINNMGESLPMDKWLVKMQQGNYYKFLNGQYPFLFWEPSDEYSIKQVVAQYQKGPLNDQGIRFAINIDPVQFMVYGANLTRDGTNIKLASQVSTSIVTAAGFVISIAKDVSTGKLQAHIYEEGSQYPALTEMRSLLLSSNIRSDVCSVNSAAQFVFVAGCNGETDRYRVGINGSITLLDSFIVPLPNSGGVLKGKPAIAVAWTNGTEGTPWFVTAAAVQTRTGIVVQITSQVTELMNFTNPDILNQEGDLDIALDLTPVDNGVQIVVAISYKNYTYLATTSFVPGKGSQRNFHLARIGVGNQPSVSFAAQTAPGKSFTADPLLLQVHSGGRCDNSEFNNKNQFVSVCHSAAKATPHSGNAQILNYNYGPVSYWQEAMSIGEPITSCSHTVLHGVFNQGHAPHCALYSGKFGVAGVVLHKGRSDSTAAGFLCGLAQPHAGNVLSGWLLPSVT